MNNPTNIEQSIKDYILKEVLSGEDPAHITESTPLFTSGILDSIATLRLVQFLEEEFLITIDANEVSPQYLDTIGLITQLVVTKVRV